MLAHRPSDERETSARIRILDALDTLESPFDRHANPTHVTASAVLVGRRGTVLHLHRHLRRWLQPGGHLEAGEMPYEAALRESQEETGLELTHPGGGPRLVHVDVHPGSKGHIHLDLRFVALAEDREPSPPPGESQQVRWFSWDEAEAIADEALVGAVRVARRQPEALLVYEMNPLDETFSPAPSSTSLRTTARRGMRQNGD